MSLGVLMSPQRFGDHSGEGAAQFAGKVAAEVAEVDGGRAVPVVAVKDDPAEQVPLVVGQRDAQ